jgi:hypothetical protein
VKTIAIDDDIHRFLLSKAIEIGESASSILRRVLNIDGQAERPPMVVEFHIAAGTSGGPWNIREEAVAAVVGDTLRILNDDAEAHRLHTTGIPFGHPPRDILPGESEDFFLESPLDPATNGPLRDHDFGPGAQFWIEVRKAQEQPVDG